MLTRLLAIASSAVRSHWRLVVGLWAVHLLMAATVAVPLGAWLTSVLGTAVEATSLASGLDITALADLIEIQGAGEWMLIALGTAAVLLIAALASAFIAGGVVSRVGDWRREPESFGMAGARYFWPNLRMLVIAALIGGLLASALYAALRGMTRPMVDSLSEAALWTRALLPLAGAGLAVLFTWLVLDFARIGLVATADRRGRRHLARSARFVLRHLWGVAGWWLVVACGVALALAAYLAIERVVGGPTWPQIVVVFVLQQLFLVWRAATHVGRVAGQVEQARSLGLVVPEVDARPVPDVARVEGPASEAPAPPEPIDVQEALEVPGEGPVR